jgi:hypothetical protein
MNVSTVTAKNQGFEVTEQSASRGRQWVSSYSVVKAFAESDLAGLKAGFREGPGRCRNAHRLSQCTAAEGKVINASRLRAIFDIHAGSEVIHSQKTIGVNPGEQ